MADVERERITALWREAAAALEREPYPDAFLAELVSARAKCGRLHAQLVALVDAADAVIADSGAAGTWSNLDIARRIARAALGVEGEQE